LLWGNILGNNPPLMIFDIDAVETWAGPLRDALGNPLPDDLDPQLEAADLEFMSDARNLMLSLVDGPAVTARTCEWISSGSRGHIPKSPPSQIDRAWHNFRLTR
jgi:hypothetical protein